MCLTSYPAGRGLSNRLSCRNITASIPKACIAFSYQRRSHHVQTCTMGVGHPGPDPDGQRMRLQRPATDGGRRLSGLVRCGKQSATPRGSDPQPRGHGQGLRQPRAADPPGGGRGPRQGDQRQPVYQGPEQRPGHATDARRPGRTLVGPVAIDGGGGTVSGTQGQPKLPGSAKPVGGHGKPDQRGPSTLQPGRGGIQFQDPQPALQPDQLPFAPPRAQGILQG
ncbi:hypothetical protein DESC_910028 [Desulfosarcina cetonica]|nr:hypothetical protein DESC_910028 [Desulfosarcina cetonica]